MHPQQTNRKIEEVLHSMDDAARVSPHDHLWNDILRRVRQVPKVAALPRRVVWAAAASLLLLVSFNIMLLHRSAPVRQADTMDELVHEYNLNTTMNLGI